MIFQLRYLVIKREQEGPLLSIEWKGEGSASFVNPMEMRMCLFFIATILYRYQVVYKVFTLVRLRKAQPMPVGYTTHLVVLCTGLNFVLKDLCTCCADT